MECEIAHWVPSGENQPCTNMELIPLGYDLSLAKHMGLDLRKCYFLL